MAVAAAATRPQAPDPQAQRTPQRPQQASPPFSRSPDVTDAPSEAESSAPSPAGKAESEDEAQRARAASRIERKNRARLQRYHQSKAELAELRAEVVELRALLEKLKKEDGAGIEQCIASAPSPFAFSEELEINAKERAPPKTRVVTVGPSAASWREVAVMEHKKLQRAQTVKRKLMRIVAEFGQQCDTFVSMSAIVDELDAAAGVAANHLRLYQAPRVPGMDSLAAFTHNSMPVLQELYHMAAAHSGITPLASSALPKNYSGGSLAYSLFLGPEIEFSWSDGFELPGDDPAHVTSVWMRAISSQPPQPNIVKATHKSHNTEHPMYERRVTYRQSPGDILAKQTHGVKFMQKFETKDNVVIVWSRAYNVGVDADLSLFRASGWLSITKSTDSNGSPCCLLRYISRVHCATALSEEQAKLVKRSDIVGQWATSIRSKQEKMQQRLLLLA